MSTCNLGCERPNLERLFLVQVQESGKCEIANSHITTFTSSTTMSNALLLRLFLSSSYFSINVALQYLTRYYDNIGITYYLTRRLKEFRIDELRDVWGFLWWLSYTSVSLDAKE